MSTVEVCEIHNRAHCWKCYQDRVFDLERQLAGAREEAERLRGEQREWQELADTAVDVHDTWKTRFIEAREKLKAIRGFGDKLAEGHVSGTWQGLVKRDLDAILAEKGA